MKKTDTEQRNKHTTNKTSTQRKNKHNKKLMENQAKKRRNPRVFFFNTIKLTCLLVHWNCPVSVHEGWTQKSSSLLSRQSWPWSHTRLYGTRPTPLVHVNISEKGNRHGDVMFLLVLLPLHCLTLSCCQQADCASHARNSCVQWREGQTVCAKWTVELEGTGSWIPKRVCTSSWLMVFSDDNLSLSQRTDLSSAIGQCNIMSHSPARSMKAHPRRDLWYLKRYAMVPSFHCGM